MFDSQEIVEMFDALGGCAAPAQLLALPGMHVLWPERSGKRTPLERRQYKQQPQVKERRRAYERRADVARKKKQSARRRTLQELIAKWQKDAKLICIGRELSPALWLGVLKNPQTAEERAAREDFIYFLRVCRTNGVKRIAGMLETTEDVVTSALSSRGVSAK